MPPHKTNSIDVNYDSKLLELQQDNNINLKESIANVNTTNSNSTPLIEEAASLKQLYYGPQFCSDLKILYDDICFNVHRCKLSEFSKYFEALLSSMSSDEESIIRLPIIEYPTKELVSSYRVTKFFKLIYSNNHQLILMIYSGKEKRNLNI